MPDSPAPRKARYIMIGGFLGAGKTTAVAKLAQRLTESGLKVGLITNDQGRELVDTQMLRAKGFATEEIPGGCFCCRFNSLVEAAGKTVLPGLIDVHVHLAAPGEFYADPGARMLRNLAAYLYSGVTAVRSVGDPLELVLKVRSSVNSGERLGAELFTCGPLFTARGGHGTEYFKNLPPKVREQAEAQFTRIPASVEEARRQVDEKI